MPSNKKSRKAKKKPVSKQPMSPLPSRVYDAPMTRRSPPDMTMNSAENCLRRQGVLRCSRNDAGNRTACRFQKAYDMLDAFQPEDEAKRDDISIEQLAENSIYVKNCVRLIKALVSTDFRVAVPFEISEDRNPDCWSCVTRLEPLGGGNVQLAQKLTAIQFVILLATAMRIFLLDQPRVALQLVHELYNHATSEQHREWLDWTRLEDYDGCQQGLGEAFLRFALACVGVKAARRLYRERDQRQPSQSLEKLSSAQLLDVVNTFSHDQCDFQPHLPIGYWNLGWVQQQSVAKHNVNGLEGAAEMLGYMRMCIKRAEKHEDDILSANARIEAAYCLVVGASGIVGYRMNGETVQVQRDMRSAASIEGTTTLGKDAQSMPFHIVISGSLTSENRQCVIEKEKKRLRENVSSTFIAPGEDLLVPRWEVLHLWNEAMVYYDRICKMNHGCVVFGETTGWVFVSEWLKRTIHIRADQYGTPPYHGIKAKRDKGFFSTYGSPCENCGKLETDQNKQCARCKTACYCCRECQVSHWKIHKASCKIKKEDD